MLEFWADPSMDIHRPEFDTRKQIIVHCEMGWRGALAAATLQRMGFPKVANLTGGFAAWKAADRPIEPASTSPRLPLRGRAGGYEARFVCSKHLHAQEDECERLLHRRLVSARP